MKIFINDIPVELKSTARLKRVSAYTTIADVNEKGIQAAVNRMQGHTLLRNAPYSALKDLFKYMTDHTLEGVSSVTLETDNILEAERFIKETFTIIKAGGGVVEKDGKLLFIHRLGKWDLPKGKIEKGERTRKGAKREVKEETGVKAEVGAKICNTWHTYTRNKKFILKKTSWYAMACKADEKMSPQKEENIEKVEWVAKTNLEKYLQDTYQTIRYVVQTYQEKRGSS